MTKILAFSDVTSWEAKNELTSKTRPDIVALAGDLIDEGTYSHWFQARDKYWKQTHNYKKHSYDVLLQDRLFRKILEKTKTKRTEGFYNFLKDAGQKSRVLIIKGNHDEEESYDPERINNIAGCEEISGRAIEINGIRFLGISEKESYYLRLLNPIIDKFKGKIDVIILHGYNIRLISSIQPKLIIHGGSASGKYLVKNVKTVYTSATHHAIITIENNIVKNIFAGPNSPHLLKRNWIKPYPE